MTVEKSISNPGKAISSLIVASSLFYLGSSKIDYIDFCDRIIHFRSSIESQPSTSLSLKCRQRIETLAELMDLGHLRLIDIPFFGCFIVAKSYQASLDLWGEFSDVDDIKLSYSDCNCFILN